LRGLAQTKWITGRRRGSCSDEFYATTDPSRSDFDVVSDHGWQVLSSHDVVKPMVAGGHCISSSESTILGCPPLGMTQPLVWTRTISLRICLPKNFCTFLMQLMGANRHKAMWKKIGWTQSVVPGYCELTRRVVGHIFHTEPS
jgi:hypothetical protein